MNNFMLGVMVGMLLVFFLVVSFSKQTVMYKNGQIDALNGEIYYELRQQKSWEYVPGEVE